jgi:hypothetical protein
LTIRTPRGDQWRTPVEPAAATVEDSLIRPNTLGRAAAAVALAMLSACASGATTTGPSPTVLAVPSSPSLKNDGSSITVTASCVAADGTPGTGSVTFTSAIGTLNGAPAQAAVVLTAGTASVTFSCNASSDPNCAPGSVILNARWDIAVTAVHLTLTGSGGSGTDGGTGGGTDGGTDGGTGGGTGTIPAYILARGATPSALGIKGSGIQETGVATFLVTDAYGSPVPGATVNFGQQSPQLVTLASASAVSASDGTVLAAYASKGEVGVTTLTATLVSSGAVATQTIAVRGAKPSANGFYFHCDHANLPVYTTIGELETTTCNVRLTDRFGNRVGIPTVVSFATEAGAIPASVVTKGFDPSNPDDPTEGTVSVTFTSDVGNGNAPADVDPLGPVAQYPWNRGQEPSWTDGSSLTLNPRDQLVTIIAMVRGEEAFEDANHNGLLDANEVFVDQGDPFVDANDDGLYDQIGPGTTGLWETRFCGLDPDCSTYHGPNGVWDSDTIIWKPTWVVFTGLVAPVTFPAGSSFAPGYFLPFSCVDYSDGVVDANHSATMSANLYAYDYWLNFPSAGWTLSVGNLSTTKISATSAQLLNLESWGSMGVLGFDFDWVRVAAAGPNAGQACSSANGQACVEKLLFRRFSDGHAGSITVNNTVTTPSDSTTGFGCNPTSDQYKSLPFTVDVTIAQAHGTNVKSTLTKGTYARGQ